MPATPFEEVFARLRDGQMVIMVSEESELADGGDLVMAAECVTPDHVNFMVREARTALTITAREDLKKPSAKPRLGFALPVLIRREVHHFAETLHSAQGDRSGTPRSRV